MEMEELIKRLKESRGELLQVHRATGVTYSTIRSIRDGVTKHPRIDTFKKLSAHYERAQ
jgi:hypothetical protein